MMYRTETARRPRPRERHFVQVQFAHSTTPAAFKPPVNFRVFHRHAILENLRRRSGPYANDVDVVFQCERHAVKPAENASGFSLPVAFARLPQSGIRIESDERIKSRSTFSMRATHSLVSSSDEMPAAPARRRFIEGPPQRVRSRLRPRHAVHLRRNYSRLLSQPCA